MGTTSTLPYSGCKTINGPIVCGSTLSRLSQLSANSTCLMSGNLSLMAACENTDACSSAHHQSPTLAIDIPQCKIQHPKVVFHACTSTLQTLMPMAIGGGPLYLTVQTPPCSVRTCMHAFHSLSGKTARPLSST
jgi:hypothetical protein